MKNIKLVPISLLIFLGLIVSITSAQNAPILDIVLVNQNPYPAEPGQNVNIEVEIQNTGLWGANNVIIEIATKDPFKLLLGEDRIKTFNLIGAGNSVKTSYNININKSALTGNYELEFSIYLDDISGTYTKESVSINIQGVPKIILEDVQIAPDTIEPGGTVTIIPKIKNIGTGTANQLQAELISNSSDIVPILSRGLVYIGDLEPDETRVVNFELSVDTSAEQKTYTTTLELEYKDDSNTLQEKAFSIGIPVSGKILLEIIKIEPNFNRNILRIEVANKGTVVAKSIEAKLIVNNETIDIDYLSQLKANKQTTFDFPLVLGGKGKLVLDFIGPGLEKNQVTKDIVLDFNIPQGNGTTNWLLILIVIIVILYIVWRKKFRKKKR